MNTSPWESDYYGKAMTMLESLPLSKFQKNFTNVLVWKSTNVIKISFKKNKRDKTQFYYIVSEDETK